MSENDQHAEGVPALYVWLDHSIKSESAIQGTAKRIQELTNGRLRTFLEPDDCVDYIISHNMVERVYLIIADELGAKVISTNCNLPQIETVYVFCSDLKAAESYSKVGKIFTQEKSLLDQIRANLRRSPTADVIPISIFHLQKQGNSLQILSPESAKFMWYQAAMNALLFMARQLDSKQEMIIESRKQYHDDELEKQRIDKFAEEYRLG